MQAIIIVIHMLCAIALIALVLMQHGKGADAGASFGAGSSNTMFGSVGAMPFLMKITAVLAAIFFATSIGLSYLVTKQTKQQNVISLPATTTTQPNTQSNSNSQIQIPAAPVQGGN